MKQFITLLLLLIGVTLSAQEYTPDLVGKAIFSQTGGGAGYWQVSGTFTDESGAYDGSTIQVNDVLYFTDGGNGFFLPITQVTSITPPSFVVRVSNTGITLISGVPTTIGAIYHPSTNLNLPYYVSGISNPDQQTLINYLVYKIDSLVGVPEITDFIGTYDVSPAVPASGETGETWRNSVGELYYSDGTSWYTDKEIKYSTSSLQGLSSGKYKIGIDTVGTDTIYVSNNGIFRRFSTSSTTNLDEAYNNFGSNPATINVDGSQGQGDLKITASNMASIILDNTGTGTIEIRNNASPKILVTSSGLVGLNSISTNSGVEIGSSLAKALVSVTSPTWTVGNAVTYLFTSSSTQSVTLPSPSSCPSRVYTLVNPAGIDKTVSSYESLSGATSTTLPSNSSLTVQSNGFQWVATSFTSSATVSTTDGLTIDFSLSGLDITAEVKTNSLDSSHIKLRGLALNDISPSGASLGQIVKFDGTNWIVGDDGGTTYYAGTGIYISNDTIYNTIVTFSGDVSGAHNNLQIQPNTVGATELQSTGVSAGTYPISANHVPIFVLDVDGRVTSISESPITGLIHTIGNPSTTPDLQAASISNDTLYLHYADDVTPGILVASGDVSPGGATAQSGLQVDGLKGRTISNDVPDDGDCYIWDTGTNKWVPGPCGSAGSIAMDNWRLPATYLKIPALGINANESVANYSFNTINNHLYYFSSNPYGSGGEYGGWLANGTSGDSVCVLAPYWVLIGDSQAEGHPSLHGRLHPGSNTFSAFYADQTGQLSYDLSVLTNMRFFNHGIGGQTSKQVWERWQRDVLAQTYDPSDGRGSRTLRAGTKPQGVVIIVGINDIYQGSLNNTWHVTSNLENMAKSARDNGIQCVFLNCPGDEINTALQNRKVDSINVWMQSGILQSYGASVVDYNTWWRDPAYDDNSHAQALIVDDIHPSTAGYTNLANYIFNTAKLPVLDSVTIYTKLSPTAPVSGYSRPTTVTIQGSPYPLTGEKITVPITNSRMTWDSVWVKIDASTNITGTSYSGISHIVWHVRNDTAGLATRRPELYQGYQPNISNVWTRASGVLSPSTVTDKVAIGLSTTSKVLEMRGTTNDATVDFAVTGLAGTTASLAVSNNGRVAINANSTPYNFGVYGNMIVQKTTSDYWFFDGSSSQMYGTQPTHRWQSTTVNTGGTGYTEMTVKFDGSYYYFQPASGSAGKNVPIRFDRKSGANVLAVDLDRNMIGYNAPVYQGPYIDFNKATRAMWIPSIHRDSFNVGGGYGGVFGYNNTDHLFQGVVNNARHTFVTNVSTDTHTTNDVLTWNGTGWVSQAATGGTIGGSIASTQIAYGSGTNTITGDANFVYDAGAAGMSIKGGTPSLTLNATSTSAFGYLFSYNNAPRFRFIYQENINEFRLQGTDAAGDFTVNPAILAKRGASGNKVGFNLAAGSTPAGQIHVNGSGATSGTYTAQFHNSTGTSNSLVVRDDGKVGIGTAAPSTDLTIANANSPTTGGIRLFETSDAANYWTLFTGGPGNYDNNLNIAKNGTLISTVHATDGWQMLSGGYRMKENSPTVSNVLLAPIEHGNSFVRFIRTATGNGDNITEIAGWYGIDMKASAYGLPTVRINSSGRVGIGYVTTYGAQLQVQGAGATSGTYTALFHNSSGTSNSLAIRDDGNIGIGTNAPSAKLHVIGNYEQRTSSGTVGIYRINEPGGDQVRGTWDYYVNANLTPDFFGKFGFKFEGGTNNAAKQFQIHVSDASAPKMVINGLGNVGVGNASPTRTLDINGELRIRDLATTTATQILVADNDGVVSSATLGSGLSLSGGAINNSLKMREESFTATGGQTAFTIAYSAPAVSGTSVPLRVYRNGVRLFWVASAPTSTQFTYSGTTVTTASNTSGDIITIEYLN